MAPEEPQSVSVPKAKVDDEDPPTLEAPLIDNRYKLQTELGRGGMGVVYLAKDVGLQRDVALKVISPKWASDPEWVEGFQREAVALASVHNQHVVQVFAFGRHGASLYFAMQYVRGRNLGTILNDYRRHGAAIPVHRALTILSRLAEGLDAVHAAGLVHRDVKPDNVVIEEDTGRPVLVDFGLAVPSATKVDTLDGGTPDYMAPEQTWMAPFGSLITPRTDVYSLGCIAFEIFANRRVFESLSRDEVVRAHMRTPPPALAAVRPALAAFDPVLARALAKDPAARYETCPEMTNALVAASSGGRQAGAERLMVPHTGGRGEPRRVLVVDDDPHFLKFATRAVQLAFYGTNPRIAAVSSGAEAIARSAREPPDLVLLDFDMPGLDGLETLSQLRALPYGGRARVVVLSGKAGRGERWRFSILGVNDFVDKPVELEKLVEGIARIAARAGWNEGAALGGAM